MEKENSQNKLTQELLWERENILQGISTTIKDAVIMIDNRGKITFWNEASMKLFGYSRLEVLGHDLHQLISPVRFLKDYQDAFRNFQSTGEGKAIGQTIELSAIRKDGLEFPVELSLSSIKVKGEWCAIGILHDITTRKLEEEAVLHERRLLRTLIDNLPDTIYVKDPEGKKIIANPADLKIMGYTSEAEVVGKTDLDLLNPEIGMRGYKDDMAILHKQEATINREEDFIDSDGNERWLYTTKMPLFDSAGNIMGLVGIGRDFTERRKIELQLEKQTIALKELNATKDKFFSIIAHDLRSPFNAFLNLTKMIEENFPSMTQEQVLTAIQTMGVSATSLFRLLENLLEWSRMQQGMIRVSPESFLLLPSIKSTLELSRESAGKKGIEISCSIPENLTVYADEKMVDGILRNLSSNAIKFTPQRGKVILSAKQIPGNMVEVSVKDTGIGMTRGMVNDLFTLDVNTSRRGTEGEPSSGLGLILCKEFVEKNGGQIRVESEQGSGSTFYFTLPYKEDELPKSGIIERKPGAKVPGKGNNLKILVVDDDLASKLFLLLSLKNYGHTILEARNGVEAVETCCSNPDLDLVLMDLSMPDRDGFEATRQIREFNQSVIIIVQTALELPDSREKAVAAGCDEYIMKPIDIVELKGLIRKHFRD